MAYSLTVRDVIDHLVDWSGHNVSGASVRVYRRAILNAYREITQHRKWSYYQKKHRIQLNAAYDTGTIAYDHTGGASERLVTLTTGTFPAFGDGVGTLRVAGVSHLVSARLSDTTLQLDSVNNPGADIASGTSYSLVFRYYTLPADYLAMDFPQNETNWWYQRYVQPRDLLARERYTSSTGPVDSWSVVGHPLTRHRYAILVEPPSGTAESYDFWYMRRPRELAYSGHESRETDGTVAMTSGQITCTGTSTNFKSGMVGSVLRIGDDATNVPGGRLDTEPFLFESDIDTFNSSTSITTKDSIGETVTGKKYVISDPVDIDRGMEHAFLRCCEYHLGIVRRAKNLQELSSAYLSALMDAASSDSRVYQPRFAGDNAFAGVRLSDLPLGDDDA